MKATRTVYEYDEAGLYVGETTAEPSPREKDVWLIPANATELEPPITGEHECAVFRNGRWSVRYDYRGTTYWLPDGTEHTITETGMIVPEDALTEPPPPSLETVRQRKLAELDAAFASASGKAHCLFSAGFEVNADETASQNVANLVLSMEAKGQETARFRAYDNTFHELRLSQLKTLQLEIIAHREALYARKWALRDAIAAARSVKALENIDITFDQPV
ncbi:DUF4376 domain-containing protein [Oxalobacter paraformigenes]|uniref:DUF4376 domain-containing protein n=1 Tax=Oxalobacter paraformigenes TaxID=556268 RepID=C3X3W0_9BURK|nr:DUF4376 domain-containing protein [Oxalobacter paraformigenes]EEO27896.1 hypothetical protein OFAG_01049 [Oxalobacter paraformigenes]